VKNNLIMSAAAASPSTCSMSASPTMLPPVTDAWRNRVPATGLATGVTDGLRRSSNFQTIPTNHNSIASRLAVPAYRVDAKQAAPPRGPLR
jgi:hypothetical protein